jgi:sulfotransferase
MNKVSKKKKYNIITGLPRSGSTLLCNILNQNPKFHASETSALVRVLSEVKMGWENIIENQAVNNLTRKANIIKSLPNAYYKDNHEDVIFDKNRMWLSESQLARFSLGEDVKFIVCVRNLIDIIASFEKLHRKYNHIWNTTDKKNFPKKYSTIEGRCELLTSDSGPVGSILIMLREFVIMQNMKNTYFLDYNDLVKHKDSELKRVYEFLEEDYFEHDFDNVEQTTYEDDRFHGILGLHNIRAKVKYDESKAIDILGPQICDKYKGQEFWKNN